MKNLLALLLALSLLLSLAACGAAPEPEPEAAPEITEPEPEPEPEPPDPRALWENAAELAAAYQSLEADEEVSLEAHQNHDTYTARMTTRFRAADIGTRMARYQVVTTGDGAREFYYHAGTAYSSSDLGSYRSMMTVEELEDYLSEENISLHPDQFDTIELVSGEDGWELAFSAPNDRFLEMFEAVYRGENVHLRKNTIDATGTVRLDRDGHYSAVAMELTAAASILGEEATLGITVSTRYFSHDEDVSITFPSKLQDFTEVDDIRTVEYLQTVFSNLGEVTAVDYTGTLTFDGTVAGAPVTVSHVWTGTSRLDLKAMTIRYSQKTNGSCSVFGEESTYAYTLDYQNGVQRLTGEDGSVEEVPIKQTDAIGAFYANMLYLCDEYTPLYYLSPVEEEHETERRIHFQVTGDVTFTLFNLTLTLLDEEKQDALYSGRVVDVSEYDGLVVVDPETELPKSVAYSIRAEFVLPDGSTVAGWVYYEKEFHAFGNDVLLPVNSAGKGA